MPNTTDQVQLYKAPTVQTVSTDQVYTTVQGSHCPNCFYFSSVFTKEDISSLPVADAKFQEAKSD